MACAAQELGKAMGKSLHSSEWCSKEGLLMFRDHIYVPNELDLRRCIVELHHDTKVVGHTRRWKTPELVSQSYWWLQMSRYIGTYCKTCNMCL